MRRLIPSLLALALLAAGGTAPAAERHAARPVPKPTEAGGPPIRIAVEGAYPPFSEVAPDGTLRGFDVDIARALCAELRARCEFVQRDWDRIQDAVLGKPGIFGREFDAVVASVSITDSRRRTVDFTDKYYHVPARFVRRKGSGVEVDEAGLAGRRIAVQAQTTHAAFARRRYGGAARVATFPTLPEAVEALRRGEVDLVLGDALALERGPLAGEQGAGLEFVGPHFTDPRYFGQGVGIAVAKGNEELRERLDRALDRIRKSGEHARIARRYFGFELLAEEGCAAC